MENVHRIHGALRLAISLVQDNICRECKNQIIIELAVKLSALDVLESMVYLHQEKKLSALNVLESMVYLYQEKGHTHGPLDATFCQMCVKLSLEECEDDLDVVSILDDFTRTSALDAGTR